MKPLALANQVVQAPSSLMAHAKIRERLMNTGVAYKDRLQMMCELDVQVMGPAFLEPGEGVVHDKSKLKYGLRKVSPIGTSWQSIRKEDGSCESELVAQYPPLTEGHVAFRKRMEYLGLSYPEAARRLGIEIHIVSGIQKGAYVTRGWEGLMQALSRG